MSTIHPPRHGLDIARVSFSADVRPPEAAHPGKFVRSDLWCLGAFALVLSYQILLVPIVALANNGDFGKVLGRFSLAAPVEDEYAFAPTVYRFDPKNLYRAPYSSSEVPIAAAAIAGSSFVSKSGEFDIRWVGAVHCLLLVLAVPLLARVCGTVTRSVFLMLITLVFGDAMYAGLMNSFYMDAAAVVFLALALVFYLRSVVLMSRMDAWFAATAFCGLAGAKAQHAILGIPLALLLLLTMHREFGGRRFTLLAATAVLVVSGWTLWYVPDDYAEYSAYTVLFTGVLPHSASPVADLQEMGLSAACSRYIGTHAFDEASGLRDPGFTKEFAAHGSRSLLAKFFLRHPAKAFGLLRRSLNEAGKQRPGLGNFDRGAGFPGYFESQAFANWSRVKRGIFAGRGTRYLWWMAILGAVAVAGVGRGFTAGALCLLSMLVLDLLVSGLADAVEVARHFTLFNAMVDASVFVVVGYVLAWSGKVRHLS